MINMNKRELREYTWNALVVWEAMLEKHQAWENKQGTLIGRLPSPMDDVWAYVGTNEMRDMAITISEWVEYVFKQLEMILGDDPLVLIGLEPFDWEFVPHLLEHYVVWNREVGLPAVDTVAAKLIAMRAHNLKHA